MYMSRIKIILDKLCNGAKLPKGPITEPKPGPMLPNVVTLPVIPIVVFF